MKTIVLLISIHFSAIYTGLMTFEKDKIENIPAVELNNIGFILSLLLLIY